MVDDLVGKLMLGSEYHDARNNKRMYEGLFEVVDAKGRPVRDHIPLELQDVRDVMMDKFIRPVSSYLRFNRGEMSEGLSTKTIKLKDLSAGYDELKVNLQEGITKVFDEMKKEYDK